MKSEKTNRSLLVARGSFNPARIAPRPSNSYIDAISKQHKMLLTAGCLIIPCFRQFEPLLKPKSLSALNPFASIWCCIENMLIAAAAEWIYGVTRIPFDEEIKHLKLEWKKECILTNGNILVRFMIK